MGLAGLDPRSAADKGAELHLRNPMTDAPLFEDGEPVTVTVLGADSPRVRAVAQDMQKRKAKGEKVEDGEFGTDLLAASIIGWSKSLSIEEPGDLPFSQANIRKLLTDERTEWVADQIVRFTTARRNFAANQLTG